MANLPRLHEPLFLVRPPLPRVIDIDDAAQALASARATLDALGARVTPSQDVDRLFAGARAWCSSVDRQLRSLAAAHGRVVPKHELQRAGMRAAASYSRKVGEALCALLLVRDATVDDDTRRAVDELRCSLSSVLDELLVRPNR